MMPPRHLLQLSLVTPENLTASSAELLLTLVSPRRHCSTDQALGVLPIGVQSSGVSVEVNRSVVPTRRRDRSPRQGSEDIGGHMAP